MMQAAFTQAPVVILLRLYSEFVIAARRDIGYPGTAATPMDIMGSRVKDLYTSNKMRWAFVEPFEVVCARSNWHPPWLSQYRVPTQATIDQALTEFSSGSPTTNKEKGTQ